MEISIKSIPQEAMRYATQGDWQEIDGVMMITVAADTEDEQFLIGLHEMVEAYLCKKHGVTEAAVDAFDLNFTGEGEPGDAPNSPYRREHRKAMLIEHLMASFLGLSSYGAVL